MKRTGQFILVSISVLFTAFQKIIEYKPFFTMDFFIFTIIAWIVGYQYDKVRYFEKKAQASVRSYKKLIDLLPDPVYITRDHRFLYVNKAAMDMMGVHDLDEVMEKTILDFIVPEYSGRLFERYEQVKKEDRPNNTVEYKAKRPDGTVIFFEVSSLSIIYGDKEAILSIGKDITERKKETERLLQKSEKLALLGQMAAGIAHEIRNPLTSIKGFIQLFKSNHLKGEYYDIVLSELDRINDIVAEFLVLAKPSAAVLVKTDVKELIKDVVILINTQAIMKNIQIFVEFESGLPEISCEANQMKQVFLNLLKNALEAMSDGGTIDVKVKEKEDGKISVKITDHGVGIPEDRIPTLGEPFYTTKEKGTGLGLMTCYRIIESHKGELKISSKMNEGTTVEVILPTVTQPFFKKEMVHP